MKNDPVIVEKIYNAPVKKIWKAITDKNEMKQWYFDLEEFRPEVGFEFSFYGGSADRQYLHLCRVTEVITEEKLSYSWSYEGYTGRSNVTFELFPEGNSTRLRLTHEGLETFPGTTSPDFARTSFESGWNEIIGNSLKKFVEK